MTIIHIYFQQDVEGLQWGKPGPGGAYWRNSAVTGQGFFDKMVNYTHDSLFFYSSNSINFLLFPEFNTFRQSFDFANMTFPFNSEIIIKCPYKSWHTCICIHVIVYVVSDLSWAVRWGWVWGVPTLLKKINIRGALREAVRKSSCFSGQSTYRVRKREPFFNIFFL